MNTPTKITLSRIVLIVLTILGLAILDLLSLINPLGVNHVIPAYVGNSNINPVFLVVFVIFVIASLTDFLDGYLARKNNQVTDLGKFLDPVADKLLVNSMIIFLCIHHSYTSVEQTPFPIYAAIIIIARDIVVDALRFIAAKKNIVIAANIFGKIKTVSEMIVIPCLLLNGWPFTYLDKLIGIGVHQLRIVSFLIYITAILSLLSGIIYVVKNRNVFKESKDNTSKLVNTLIKKNITIGAVESLTAGKFISNLANIPGASKVVKGGLTTYQSSFKTSLLKISKKDIDKYGVVSSKIAKEMALEGSKILNTDIVISFTGNAGPTSDVGNAPVGQVYIGVLFAKNKKSVKIFSKVYKGDRNTIRSNVIEDANTYILHMLGEAK